MIHKSSERTRSGEFSIDDADFTTRWAATRAAGVIRGSFHYYRHLDGAGGDVPADRVVDKVERLVPGDLAPALDFENAAVCTGSAEPTAPAWRTELQTFLDTLERKLGRIPLIYTSASAWSSHITSKPNYQPADFARFKDYPLWVKHYFGPRFVTVPDLAHPGTTVTLDLDKPPHPLTATFRRAAADRADNQYRRRQTLLPTIPLPWIDFAILQYSPYTPGTLLNNQPFSEMSVDLDVTEGGPYSLRGLAEIGRPAVVVGGSGIVVAHADEDDTLHLISGSPASQTDISVSALTNPNIGGDPAAILSAGVLCVYFRQGDTIVQWVQNNASQSAH